MLKKFVILSFLSAFLINKAIAQDIDMIGTIQTPKPSFNKNNINAFKIYPAKNEYITLLKLNLSTNAINNIEKRAQRAINNQKLLSSIPKWMPKQIELGMNDVPVLNQGNHGSCVIFATTAALDAAINKGDYVSQICQLSLGRYIENNGHAPSGWNGTFARNILSELELFGFISKDIQRTNGCAGLTEYPESGEDLLNEESVAEFHKFSEKLIDNNISWTSILDIFEAGLDSINEEQLLLETKKAIFAGDRIIIGAILIDYEKGVVGAQGTYKNKYDSWVLSSETIKDISSQRDYVGHALLITGYNDNAISIDDKGISHRGLLTLRNSWGSNIGDKGDFYMSYDYFKALVIEAQRVRHLES